MIDYVKIPSVLTFSFYEGLQTTNVLATKSMFCVFHVHVFVLCVCLSIYLSVTQSVCVSVYPLVKEYEMCIRDRAYAPNSPDLAHNDFPIPEPEEISSWKNIHFKYEDQR